MANYSLVTNSKFQPFSFERYLQPYQIYGQAYREQEDALAELETKASIWDKMANEATDPKAHAIYKKYADDLQAQSEELSRYGLTPASRQSMLNMRSRYARDITPIETAYKRREEQMKQQNAILAQDPTHMFARRAAETSLDAFLEQPTLDTIAQNYSGSLLTKQVSDAAAALAKDARNDPNVQTELRKLLPYQYETIRRTGFAPEAVRQAILNSPNADKILTGLVDTAMANSGMNDWNYTSPEEKARIIAQARNYANQGLWSAVGQTQYGNVSDSYGMQSALEATRHANAMAEAREKNKGKLSDGEADRGWNFLETSGTLAGYEGLRNKLQVHSGGLAAKYFGKKFKNPIAIRDEAMKAAQAARQAPLTEKEKRSAQLSGTALYQAQYGGGSPYDEIRERKAQAAIKATLAKYGATELISPQEYKQLKELGYTSSSNFQDFKNYSSRVNERAAKFNHASVNLNETALSNAGDIATGYLKYAAKHGMMNVTAWEMNADGSIGKPISDLSDVDIDLTKDNKLTDVFYSRQAPDKAHIQYGGQELYVDPNTLGDVAAGIVNESNQMLKLNDASLKAIVAKRLGVDASTFTAEQARDFVVRNTRAMLRDAVRGYNKGRSNTDNNI